VLDRFEAGQLQAIAEQAELLRLAFAPLAAHAQVKHLRQQGLILAFDVQDAGLRFAERFHLAARAQELLIRPIGNTVYLMPPYVIDAEAATFLARAVTLTLDEVLSQSPESGLSDQPHVA